MTTGFPIMFADAIQIVILIGILIRLEVLVRNKK